MFGKTVEGVELEMVAETTKSGDSTIVKIEIEAGDNQFLEPEGSDETAHTTTKVENLEMGFKERLDEAEFVLLVIFLIETTVEPTSEIRVGAVGS